MGSRPARIAVLAACALVWGVSAPAGPARHAAARTAATALGVAPAIAAPAEPVQQPSVLPGTHRHIVRFRAGRLRREFVEVVPSRTVRRLPLVVVLHGRRQTPWRAERLEGWDRYAATGQALVAYGAGYGGSWNAGRCCGPAERAGVDDVRFVLTLIRLEERRHLVDRRRVFVVGFSNGGMLAYRFACAEPQVISAFAVVAGAQETSTCRPARPLSLIDVQGDRDRVVPLGGTTSSRVAGAPIRSVAASLRPWQRAAGRAAVVQLIVIRGLGHEWPTLRRGGWDATDEIWRYLVTHPASTS